MEQTALANTKLTKELKVYTGIAARALKMLATGVTQVETAKALGVSEGQISQFMAEPDFQEQLHSLVSQAFKDGQEIDDNYQKIEKALSKKLSDMTELMYNPDQILRTLKFANEAKRKVVPNLQNGSGHNGNQSGLQVAVLVLPTIVKKEFILNPLNEIVAVDNESLDTLNSKTLDAIIERRKVPKLTNGNHSKSTDPYSDL